MAAPTRERRRSRAPLPLVEVTPAVVAESRFRYPLRLAARQRSHGIEPLGYLRDLLILIRGWPDERLLELASCNWKKTLEQPEAQQKLLANVFRQVVLSPPP
jgi:hypothetical protein